MRRHTLLMPVAMWWVPDDSSVILLFRVPLHPLIPLLHLTWQVQLGLLSLPLVPSDKIKSWQSPEKLPKIHCLAFFIKRQIHKAAGLCWNHACIGVQAGSCCWHCARAWPASCAHHTPHGSLIVAKKASWSANQVLLSLFALEHPDCFSDAQS